MKYFSQLLVLGVCAVSAGCETFTRPTQRLNIEKGQAVLVDTVATRRGTYLFKKEQNGNDPQRWVLVAEPPPDAALASAVKAAVEASAKVPAGEGSGKASVDVAQTLTKLVERTQAITILRDAMFRLSEAYANGTIDKETYGKKYSEVLGLVKNIVVAEANRQKMLLQAAESNAKVIDAQVKELDSAKGEERLKILNNLKTLGGDGWGPR